MTPMDRIRSAGLKVFVDGGRLWVEPRSALTEEMRQFIRAYREQIIGELVGGSPCMPPVTCAACQHFEPRDGEIPDGHCRRYDIATWSAVLFRCTGYSPADPAVRALEDRRRKVIGLLRADPALKYAFDVTGATLPTPKGQPKPANQPAISVMLGLRDSAGTIITGELTVPAEKWDTAAFISYGDAQRTPS